MNEKSFSTFLREQTNYFESLLQEQIKIICNEYTVRKNGLSKQIDLYIETDSKIMLIECKRNLIAHDIGQLLTYNIMFGIDTSKELILGLAYLDTKEYDLIRDYIDYYNLSIKLLHYDNSEGTISIKNIGCNKEIGYIHRLSNTEKILTSITLSQYMHFFEVFIFIATRYFGIFLGIVTYMLPLALYKSLYNTTNEIPVDFRDNVFVIAFIVGFIGQFIQEMIVLNNRRKEKLLYKGGYSNE